MTYGQIRRHGGFDIGTYNARDGEMIGFGSRFWQVKGDGCVHPVPDWGQAYSRGGMIDAVS